MGYARTQSADNNAVKKKKITLGLAIYGAPTDRDNVYRRTTFRECRPE